MKIPEIGLIDEKAIESAKKRLDSLIKPRGSLGRLEEIVCRIAGIRASASFSAAKKRLILFASDHGITDEGVSAYPREVTAQMVRNFIRGKAAINILAASIGIDVQVVDMGMETPIAEQSLHPVRIRAGSRNFAQEPAMTIEEMESAVQYGINCAASAKKDRIDLIAAGEMGIGNTTSASAIYAALLNVDPDDVTGPGAGISETTRVHKANVIRSALKKWNVSATDPWGILRHFGGYEIAAIAGFYLGCAAERLPVLVDGFICGAAASIAIQIAPECKVFLLFAHHSAEKGFDVVASHLDIRPLLNLDMRLGEGTGAALAMVIVESAVNLYRTMPTFDEAEVSVSERR